MTDHLHTRARRGSIADMQLCGPPRWLANKSEAIAVERIRPGQHHGHAIELQIWHPRPTKMLEKETIPVWHELRTQIHHLPDAADADHNLHPLLDYLPSSTPTLEQTSSQRRSPRTQVHHKDAAAVTPSLLEQTRFQIHPQRYDQSSHRSRI